MGGGAFDTYIAGERAAIDDAGQRLKSLRAAYAEAADDTHSVRSKSNYVWTGRAGDAYRDFNKDLTKALDEMKDRSARAEDLFFSYAQQLAWRQEEMQEHRDKAIQGDLVVDGTWINAPEPVVCPARPPDPKASAERRAQYGDVMRAYERYCEQLDLFLELEEKTAKTFRRLEDWIEINLAGAVEELNADSLATIMGTALSRLGLAVSAGKSSFSSRAVDLRDKATKRATEAARRASGNPAVRSGQYDPNPASVQKRAEAHPNAVRAGRATDMAKRFGRIGTALTIATAGLEISQGASPSGVLVGVAGGIIGGTVGMPVGQALGTSAVGLIGAVTGHGPGAAAGAMVGGVAGTVIGSMFCSWAARSAYTSVIPQQVRELIDEGMKDAWGTITSSDPPETIIVSDTPESRHYR